MTRFVPRGPRRRPYQRRGLRKMIECRGVAALLFDPGTGKTATTLDYMSVMALKSHEREVRVLVVCPLAAVDTWVSQSMQYVADGINVWAEVLGGALEERAEALASRGGKAFTRPLSRSERAKRRRLNHPPHGARGMHAHRSWALQTRAPHSIDPLDGPDALGSERPRLIIEVVNFDTFQSRRAVGSRTMADVMVRAVERYDPHLVVVDESHKIKSPSSNVSRLLSRIGERVPRRIMLTGTVMPHSPLDVFGQWRFLDPTAFGEATESGVRLPATYSDFKEKYAQMGGWMGKQVTGFKRLDEMQAIMAERSIVVRKEDALDLPPVTEVVVPVHLSPSEQAAYDQMKKKLAAQAREGMLLARNRLEQLMRLRQITSGMRVDSMTVGKPSKAQIGTSKIDTITSIVNDTLAGEKRIVIFCQFKDEIAALAKAIHNENPKDHSRPITHVDVIEGGVHGDERMTIRRRFGSDDPARLVIIAQIRTLSLAVNELVTASHAIFGSLSTQRDDFDQAKARLDRSGQTRPVTFWYALAPGTVDEVIFDSIQKRTNLEAAMMKHILERESERDEPADA